MRSERKPFSVFRNDRKKLSTVSTEEMREELEQRETSDLIFPLEVFHPKVKPFLEVLVNHYDIPRSFVGLSLLSAYSTAIGSAYRVSTNRRNTISLAVWACLEGISSSGKSFALDMLYEPLYQFQNDYDRQWDEDTKSMKSEKKEQHDLKTVIYRDAHIPTLVRYIMPDNPKGVAKHSDEIMEWLNGMNQLSKKEGTDEQFWLSTWNGKPYSGLRSRKEKFVLPRPFVNVVGGIQPTITYKLFAKDRDTTGFIFRLLFAVPEEVKIASPDQLFMVPEELETSYHKSIKSLYHGLPVYDAYDDPKLCVLEPQAVQEYNKWVRLNVHRINHLDDIREKEIHSGILGKIKEYALRFSGLLLLADRANENQAFDQELIVPQHVMTRALKLADYFYNSAVTVYERVHTSMTAPVEVLRVAAMMKIGYSIAKIAEAEYGSTERRFKLKMYRLVSAWVKEYPKVFNAVGK